MRLATILALMLLAGCGKPEQRAGYVKLNRLTWECTKTGPIDVEHRRSIMAGRVFAIAREPDTKGTACTQWTMKGSA